MNEIIENLKNTNEIMEFLLSKVIGLQETIIEQNETIEKLNKLIENLLINNFNNSRKTN